MVEGGVSRNDFSVLREELAGRQAELSFSPPSQSLSNPLPERREKNGRLVAARPTDELAQRRPGAGSRLLQGFRAAGGAGAGIKGRGGRAKALIGRFVACGMTACTPCGRQESSFTHSLNGLVHLVFPERTSSLSLC